MSLDQRARSAAAALQDGLERLPQPQGAAVAHRARHRRRITRTLAATAVVTVICLGALVVVEGREDPAPIETTGDAFANLPEGAVVAGQWTMVPKQSAGLPAASSLSNVASSGTSFLVAGGAPTDDGSTAAIWRSGDGLHWQRAVHPRSDGQVQAIAAAGDTALAVGTDGPLSGSESTFVWRSDDGGRTWSDVAHGPDLFGPPAPAMGRPFVDGLLHAEGWWIAQGGAADGYAGVWVSREGKQWTQVLDSPEAGSASIVAGVDGELFAYWVRFGWFTTDPTSWGEPTELATPDAFYPSAVAESASLAVGTSQETPETTVLMRSADGGRSWSTDETFAQQFPDAWLLTVHRSDQTWIAAGASGQPNRPAAWTSSDGHTWSALPAELAGPPGGTLDVVASAGDTTVMFGTAPELGRYYVLRSGPQADDPAAPRVFRHAPSPDFGGEAALVRGVLRYDAENGCFLLEGDGVAYPVVWPAGTEGVAEGPGVELPDGLIVTVGQEVSGGGGYHQADDDHLAGFDLPAECLPPTGEVAVYNVNEPLNTP